MPQPTKQRSGLVRLLMVAGVLSLVAWGWAQETTPGSGAAPAASQLPADPVDPGSAVPGDAVPGDAVPGDAVPGDAPDGAAVPDGGESTSADATDSPAADTTPNTATNSAADSSYFHEVILPLIILALGIAVVLGLIIGFKVNAFIALISAAMVVSLMAPGEPAEIISRVANAFGSSAGGIGIVIALAAVIGKCMLDSGAADRIVRAFVGVLGEKRAPLALMGSGYVLAIPVFFDTVFYLLVPLARSLHRRTGVQYLKYILAIAAGGALTHSLVPPTPGPMLMASTLNVDLGMMILIGAMVALPAALGGVLFADIADRIMKTPMRPLAGETPPEPVPDDKLPSLAVSLLPVLLPVLLISTNTGLSTYADMEQTARFKADDVAWDSFQQSLLAAGQTEQPGALYRLWETFPEPLRVRLAEVSAEDPELQADLIVALNRAIGRANFYRESDYLGVTLSGEAKKLLGEDQLKIPAARREHMNRLLLEESTAEQSLFAKHKWLTVRRQAANYSGIFGNPNFALLLSTVIAIWTLVAQRGLSRMETAQVVETSLMSGGVIILITAGGGAFGAMLKAAQIGPAIQALFAVEGSGGGIAILVLGFSIASVLKVAQGSGTVAMIVGSSMMAAIVGDASLPYHAAYLATAIGSGSLMGSWMNDSGFWIFAKMGGLTETEALKSWTLMLMFLGLVSFAVTVAMALALPLK